MPDNSRFAIVDANGIVLNTAVIGDQMTRLIPDADGIAGQGHTWNGKTFIAPPQSRYAIVNPAGLVLNVIAIGDVTIQAIPDPNGFSEPGDIWNGESFLKKPDKNQAPCASFDKPIHVLS